MKIAFALVIAALAVMLQVADAAAVPRPLPDFELLSYLEKRGIIDDVKEKAADIWSTIKGAGMWTYIGNLLPTPTNIKRKLGISDAEVAKLPVGVLNIPGYANWTGSNWNLRLHGAAYKTPRVNWDSLTSKFIPGGGIDSLKDDDERNQARNLTARLFSLPVKDVQFVFNIRDPADNRDLDTIVFPQRSTSRGEFDIFIPLDADKFKPSTKVQQLKVYTNGTDTGDSTAYLVPSQGPLVISDIDDVLRITKIFFPKEGILNSFARKFVPWKNMPEIFAQWKQMMPNIHFHYSTTTPEPGTSLYMNFIYKTYPLGSFDTRPLSFQNVFDTLNPRFVNIRRMIETFRQRHIVLIGDTSNSDIMKDYPTLMQQFPDTVKCLLIRNTSSTESHIFPYDTSHFKNVPREKYMFFRTPDDLVGLNFENGDCRNSSVNDHVTFSRQNLPFGLGKSFAGEPFSLIKSFKQIGNWISQKWKARFS